MVDHQNNTDSNPAAIWFLALESLGIPLGTPTEYIYIYIYMDQMTHLGQECSFWLYG